MERYPYTPTPYWDESQWEQSEDEAAETDAVQDDSRHVESEILKSVGYAKWLRLFLDVWMPSLCPEIPNFAGGLKFQGVLCRLNRQLK